MIPNFININGSTRKERNEVITLAKDAISKSGGWIVDFKMFSNMSISFLCELPVSGLEILTRELIEAGIKLSIESRTLLDSLVMEVLEMPVNKKEKQIFGTVQVTFIHNEPDLRIEVPPIPG